MGKVKKKETEATPGIGHNSNSRLKSFIERVERLEEEKHAMTLDIREVYAEAKATGFEPKIMRKVVSNRKKVVEARREEEELVELYEAALLG